MSQITIQCRLVASKATRQHLWQLMAQQNTPLINELLNDALILMRSVRSQQKGRGFTAVMATESPPSKGESA